MKMTRVCVYHVGQTYASDTPGIVGECWAIMAFECAQYQVDVIAGDGNKACFFTTPKSPGVPTYQHSLLQYWINKMMNVATQARRKNHDRFCPPVRVKHFISCSYGDLDFLATHLDGITTATYTEELMNKTSDRGDCCMMSIVEWGHARLESDEDIANFEDEDHMNYVCEVTLKINETCLNNDHNMFMVAPTDRDAHNPIVVHLKPSDMLWSENVSTFQVRWRWDVMTRERRSRGRTRGKDMMIKHGATGAAVAMVDPQLHRPQHGDQSECILI